MLRVGEREREKEAVQLSIKSFSHQWLCNSFNMSFDLIQGAEVTPGSGGDEEGTKQTKQEVVMTTQSQQQMKNAEPYAMVGMTFRVCRSEGLRSASGTRKRVSDLHGG